ncbi:MAG: alpha/beta hydrolase [Elainellaceae cyanobacterium]
MAFIDIRGVNHYYEWITDSSAEPQDQWTQSDKPVMVFIHGWAGSTRYWRTTAHALSPHFDCLLYDLRGFGQSHLPRPLDPSVADLGYELDTYADELAELLDRLKIGLVSLNAHSTGASIAVKFLNRYGDRVHKAVLTCSGIFEYNRLAFSAFHQASQYVVAFRPRWFLQVPGLDRLFMTRFLSQPIPALARREFLEDFLGADYEAALGTVYTAVSQKASLEMPEAFQNLKSPTLLISGQYDQIIPVSLGARAAALNDHIHHVVISKTGHFPMLEDPSTYLKQVEDFLALNLSMSG